MGGVHVHVHLWWAIGAPVRAQHTTNRLPHITNRLPHRNRNQQSSSTSTETTTNRPATRTSTETAASMPPGAACSENDWLQVSQLSSVWRRRLVLSLRRCSLVWL